MRYYVTIEGRELEVDLAGDVPLVDGEPLEGELVRVPGTPLRHLLVDGVSHTLVARKDESSPRWDLHLGGERLEVEVIDERTRAIRSMTGRAGAALGPKPVKAPMPGLVVDVLVAEGDAVEAGQTVAIIEAMKMENDLKAESDGVVSKIHAAAGEPVEKGAVLVELREEGESDE